jgi:pyruvate kinase
VLTTKDQQSAPKDALPVSYDKLPSMVEVGDEIFLGRYLVTGAEEASLFLEVAPLQHCRNHPV